MTDATTTGEATAKAPAYASNPLYEGKTLDEINEMRKDTQYSVPVVKAKGRAEGDTVEINVDDLPIEVYREVIRQGLKYVVNHVGFSKIAKAQYPKEAELKAAAMKQAKKNVSDMLEGKIKTSGGKAVKASGAVMTEARRIAKAMVKAEMKKQGIKVSYVDAKDITAYANQLLAQRPDIIEDVKKAIEAQAQKVEDAPSAFANLVKTIPVNEKKKAKIEAEKAKAKEQLSKTQAGKPTVRAKPAPAKA